MPTQQQFDTSIQKVRNIDCKLFVLDYDYTVLDEISGKTESVSLSVQADSDIRRTANLSIAIKDDAKQSNTNSFYWQVGNPYWFDKYIQIYVAIQNITTSEYVWVNEGVYLVNSPTISYDATTNNLSFEAVDLMSKLTGLRNGYLEGMTYSVPIGSKITSAIESVLLQQGFTQYILYTPPQQTTPQDINIDIGGTAYDLLCQLRDINANWEMFFDVDGVFHFQQIPSGKVITDPTTGEIGEPVPVVDSVIWDKLNISYNLDTNFQDVKNYIEVLGKQHEPNEYATANVVGATLNLTLSNGLTHYVNNDWIVGFGINTDDTSTYTILANPITLVNIRDNVGTLLNTLSITSQPIEIGNQYYCIRLSFGATVSTINASYLGFLQPRAIAVENNPDSPFYVGTSTQYVCGTMIEVDFADIRTEVSGEVDVTTASNVISVNLSPWCTPSDFNSASVGTTWNFKVNVTKNSTYPITLMHVIVGGVTSNYTIKNLSDENISLDYSQSYLLILTKTSGGGMKFNVLYYPIPASQMDMSTTNIANMPKFNQQVMGVCAGDEYDNIYSNELAEQRARYEIYLQARLHDSINIVSVPIYWLDVNTIIEYTLPNNVTGESDLWLVKSISTDISPNGTQTISAIRYYPLYADISLPNYATQEF